MGSGDLEIRIEKGFWDRGFDALDLGWRMEFGESVRYGRLGFQRGSSGVGDCGEGV